MGLSIPRSLLPSFLRRSGTPDKLHPTAYLDGLRGIAATCVFMHHFAIKFNPHFFHAYGFSRTPDGHPGPSSWIQLPFIRLVYSGRSWVHLFFIVSGYALSLKPLKQIRAQQYSGLLTTISSSTFRRALRLYLPLYISVGIATILACFGLKGHPHALLSEQITRGFDAIYIYSNFFDLDKRFGTGGQLETHLWTIPIEMAFSMVLFVTIVGLSKVRTGVRLGLLLGIVIYSWAFTRWQAAEFLMGMFLAELGLIQDSWKEATPASVLEKGSPDLNHEKKEKEMSPVFMLSGQSSIEHRLQEIQKSQAWQAFCVFNLVFALWLFSWPDKFSEGSSEWKFLIFHVTPRQYVALGTQWVQIFWHGIGAVQIVLACQQLPAAQKFLSTHVIQYLGKVSYASYLIHQSVLDIFSPHIVHYAQILVDGSPSRDERGSGPVVFLIGAGLTMIPLFWIADLFWRFVDVRCVKWARNIEQAALVKSI